MQTLFAGTSGWAYPSWKPGFYPADVRARDFLSHYASQVNSVEVNYTFRKLPSAAQLSGWLAQTPAEFRFSFKAPQRITHFSRLRDCEAAVDELLKALAPVADAGQMGLILFQLPPNFAADVGRLESFLTLPALTGESAPRIAFEFRHASWFEAEPIALLTAHRVGLCVASSELLETPEIHTAPGYTAFRLRQPGGYSPRQLAALTRKLTALAREREVYAYFKHEDEPNGALNARELLRLAGKAARKARG